MEIRLERRLLRWGNAYGIRVTKKEADQLGVQEKQPLDIVLRPQATGMDVTKLRFVKWGKHAARDHDKLVEDAILGGG